MIVALGIVARADTGAGPDARRQHLTGAIRRAQSLVAYSFPADPSSICLDMWADPDTGVAQLAWTNEGGPPARASTGSPGAVTIVGYTGKSDQFSLTAPPLAPLTGLAEKATGCFAVFRASPGRVEAVTDATRSSPVLVAETPRLRIVGSRSLLVHLVARADQLEHDDPRPDMDLVGLRHMANAGHFLGELTAFRGVRALGTAEHVLLDPWFERRQRRAGSTLELSRDGTLDAGVVATVSEALVDAFDVVPGNELALSLTGGRDSRLLAAALSNRPGVQVRTSTRGMPDDPDVVLAARLAKIMGVPHEVSRPAGVTDSGVIHAEDPLSRIVRALDVHDAMTSGWDDIEDYGPMMPVPRLSGVGGEVMRGGLVLPHLDELDPQTLWTQLRNILTGGHVFTPRYVESAQALAAPMLDLALSAPYEASDEYYLEHRNGRWVAARRAGSRFRRHSFDPLLDNRFIGLVRQIPAETRWRERLAFEVIRQLCPPMADLPLEGARWRFERNGPLPSATESERTGWAHRGALVRSGSTASWSWQRLDNPVARARVTELILDGVRTQPANELFDPKGVERLLAPDVLPYPTVVWHVATTAVLLSSSWWKTVRPPRTARLVLETSPLSPSV